MKKLIATFLIAIFVLASTASAYAAGVVVNVHAGSAGRYVLVRNYNAYQGWRSTTTNVLNLAYFSCSTGNNYFDWRDNRGVWHRGKWQYVPWYGAYVNLYW